MKTPQEWYADMPIVTKCYFTAICGITVLCTFGLLSPAQLFLDFEYITKSFQIWRLQTSFLYFGSLSMHFIFTISMLVTYMSSLEHNYYSTTAKRADFLIVLLFGMVSIFLVHVYCTPLYFPASIFISYLVYTWSRKDPLSPVAMYGFAFKAWHVPFIMVFMDLLFGSSLLPGLIGIFIGHVHYFISTIVPKRYGVRLLRTPQFLANVLDKAEQERQQQYVPAFRHTQGHRLE